MESHIFGIGILTWLVFLPVLGMIIVLLLPDKQKKRYTLDSGNSHRNTGTAGRDCLCDI